MEIDIVAPDDAGGNILFGECKLNGNRFTVADAARIKEKARQVAWKNSVRNGFYRSDG